MSRLGEREQEAIRELLAGLERDVPVRLVLGPEETPMTVIVAGRDIDFGTEARTLLEQVAALSGRVTLMGSPLDQARIEGQVTGADVDGVLLDDAGTQVGTFSGTITSGGIAGTYTTADGDTGDWSWAGKLPN